MVHSLEEFQKVIGEAAIVITPMNGGVVVLSVEWDEAREITHLLRCVFTSPETVAEYVKKRLLHDEVLAREDDEDASEKQPAT